MNSLRSRARDITNFVSETISLASGSTDEDCSSSTPTYGSDKSLPIPATLVKEQWRLIFTSDANAQDLEAAIAHCRDLVLVTDECSDERRWLVRHLVDLRYSLKEIKDAESDACETPAATIRTVVGHHFAQQRNNSKIPTTATRHCDHCAGIIWSVVQVAYVCNDCNFVVHQKCVDSVVRVCAHVVASERQYPISDICPEIGLASQQYKCAECSTLLNFKNSWIEPRLCDYNGLYYCPTCHWNDSHIIPARIIHNWDFLPRKVSRASLQELNLFMDKPVIKLEEANPKLFVFLEQLGLLKKMRQNLVYMRKYLMECRKATDERIIDTQLGSRRHLVQLTEYFSLNDLEQTKSGTLYDFANKVFTAFDKHIRSCSLCLAKAYICEICGNNEVIFPFDDGCIMCDKCNSIYHRICMTRKNMICPKCKRLQDRKIRSEQLNEDQNNDDIDD